MKPDQGGLSSALDQPAPDRGSIQRQLPNTTKTQLGTATTTATN